MLQFRARELEKSHNISDNEFKASRGWLRQFMKRKGLSLRRRTILCQKLPRDFTDNGEAETGDNDINDSSACEGESCLSSDDEN